MKTPRPTLVHVLIATAAALALSACCCGADGGPDLPASVPIYPKSTLVTKIGLLGASQTTFTAPVQPHRVQRYYDRKLKRRWVPVDKTWKHDPRQGSTFVQHKLFRKRGGHGYILVETRFKLFQSTTSTGLRYCASGRTLCAPPQAKRGSGALLANRTPGQ